MTSSLEVWGGVECTVNRVHDQFYDQLVRSGSRERSVSDLERFAALGLRTLRIAFHWEHFERTKCWKDWDDLLTHMDRLQITPIVGLIHHGSGPVFTGLLDQGFPEGLAEFARQVASRYPSVLHYTPINEPQTTARFSMLYGHWYPHHRCMRSFVRAMFLQMKAIVLCMEQIREVQPLARLIHTEDAGETFATPQLEAYRVDRENRRWLGADLLCGRVDESHPLFLFLLDHGLSQEEILWFREHQCSPFILGLNYYVTSDRFLDHRVELYPDRAGGDTGYEPLADVEAVRIRPEGIAGVGSILRKAWDRYHLPLAITEAHLGANAIEQARWLYEVWTEANAAKQAGVDVRAVTAWALLGSYNWCNLCTRDTGEYEPGVFDLSSGTPLPTRLAQLVEQLTHAREPESEVRQPGWWCYQNRLTFRPLAADSAQVLLGGVTTLEQQGAY